MLRERLLLRGSAVEGLVNGLREIVMAAPEEDMGRVVKLTLFPGKIL